MLEPEPVARTDRGRATVDVSSARGLSATGRVDRGRLTAGEPPAPTSQGSGRSPRVTTAGGAKPVANRPGMLRGLERVRRENPGLAEDVRGRQMAVGRATDLAVRAGLSTTVGAFGGHAGLTSSSGGCGNKGCGGKDHHGKTCYGWSFGLSLAWNSCWWGMSWYWPGYCYGYYPYYNRYCYWYGYPWYGYGYPYYAYFPIYPSYPIYYESVPSVVYVDDGQEQEVEYTEGEASVPAGEASEQPAVDVGSTSPEREEALARAASQYLKLGDRAFREGRYGDAAHFYAKAIEFAPDEGVLYLILGDALFATGDYHYAAFAVRKAAELDPKLFDAPVDKHSFYGDPAEFDRQIAMLELYLEDHYLDDDARLVLAANYLFGGRPAAAADLLDHPFSQGLRGSAAGDVILQAAKAVQHGR
jgi:hypothetical protein